MLKLNERPKTSEITLKNMAFSEKNWLFAGDFHANLDERNAYIIQFTKIWNWKWIV